MIFDLLRSFCLVFIWIFVDGIVDGMFAAVSTIKVFYVWLWCDYHYFVWLWNDYYLSTSFLINSFPAVIILYNCKIIIIFKPLYWLILYLLRSVCCFFSFELLYPVYYWLCNRIFYVWYIQFVDWLFTCLDLYVDSFHLNYSSGYVIGCFTRNDLLLRLATVHYRISRSLVDSLLI